MGGFFCVTCFSRLFDLALRCHAMFIECNSCADIEGRPKHPDLSREEYPHNDSVNVRSFNPDLASMGLFSLESVDLIVSIY